MTYATHYEYPEHKRPPTVCSCDDPAAHHVAALVASGVDQWQASQQVFSDRGRLSASIRERFMGWYSDLRLPEVLG